MNSIETFQLDQRIHRICLTTSDLVDLPKPLPPLPELITLFQDALRRRKEGDHGSIHSAAYHDNQHKIQILQNRLSLLQSLLPNSVLSVTSVPSVSPLQTTPNPPAPPSPTASDSQTQNQSTPENPNNPDFQPLKPGPNPDETYQNPNQTQLNPDETRTTRPPNAPKRGPIGKLYELPLETQDQIHQLLERHSYKDISIHLSQPTAKGGLGFTVNESLLKRFHQHTLLAETTQNLEHLAQTARQLVAAPDPEDDAHLADITQRLIKLRLLQTVAAANTPPERLCQVQHTLNQTRLTALAERRLQLAEIKQSKTTPATT